MGLPKETQLFSSRYGLAENCRVTHAPPVGLTPGVVAQSVIRTPKPTERYVVPRLPLWAHKGPFYELGVD